MEAERSAGAAAPDLPAELWAAVFAKLKTEDRMRCACVSKAWGRAALQGPVWSHVCISLPPAGQPLTKALAAFRKRGPLVRSLYVDQQLPAVATTLRRSQRQRQAATFLGLFPRLEALHLALEDCWLVSHLAQRHTGLTRLRLSATGASCPDEPLSTRELSRLSRLTGLARLDLTLPEPSQAAGDWETDLLRPLTRLTGLTKVNLRVDWDEDGDGYEGDGLAALRMPAGLSALRSLAAYHEELDIALPPDMAWATAVTCLVLGSFSWARQGEALCSLPSLRKLKVHGSPPDEGLPLPGQPFRRVLAGLTHLKWPVPVPRLLKQAALVLPALRVLETDMDGELLQALAWDPRCRLQRLVLAGPETASQALQRLGPLTTLTYLHISEGEGSVDALPPGPCVGALQELHITHCKAQQRLPLGLELATSLRSLDLSGNNRLRLTGPVCVGTPTLAALPRLAALNLSKHHMGACWNSLSVASIARLCALRPGLRLSV